MKILSIGNSFSVDSQAYIPDIARAGGADIKLGNLFIGGCSLETHAQNAKSGQPAYEYYRDNEYLGMASIQTALADDEWDCITLQQASHFSGMFETYAPYISELAAFVRAARPGARIAMNETWAYEANSEHGAFSDYGRDRALMHARLRDAYSRAAAIINADIIPVGEAVRMARESELFDPERGGRPLTRDGFHLSYTHGRYLAGAVWYEFFTGLDARENAFAPSLMRYMGRDAQGAPVYAPLPEHEPSAREMEVLRECAHAAVSLGVHT